MHTPWKFWLSGFAADAVGVVWMLLGTLGYIPFGDGWENTVSHVTRGYSGQNPCRRPRDSPDMNPTMGRISAAYKTLSTGMRWSSQAHTAAGTAMQNRHAKPT